MQNAVDKVKLCAEYIRYGARRATAERVSGVSHKQSKAIYIEVMGERPKSGRNTETWSALVTSSNKLAVPAQKFLAVYYAQCGERIYSAKQVFGVLEAYKAYLNIHQQDPIVLSLDKAYFLASCLWDRVEDAHVSHCRHCSARFPSLSPMAEQCHICVNVKKITKFQLTKRRSRASASRLSA